MLCVYERLHCLDSRRVLSELRARGGVITRAVALPGRRKNSTAAIPTLVRRRVLNLNIAKLRSRSGSDGSISAAAIAPATKMGS